MPLSAACRKDLNAILANHLGDEDGEVDPADFADLLADLEKCFEAHAPKSQPKLTVKKSGGKSGGRRNYSRMTAAVAAALKESHEHHGEIGAVKITPVEFHGSGKTQEWLDSGADISGVTIGEEMTLNDLLAAVAADGETNTMRLTGRAWAFVADGDRDALIDTTDAILGA